MFLRFQRILEDSFDIRITNGKRNAWLLLLPQIISILFENNSGRLSHLASWNPKSLSRITEKSGNAQSYWFIDWSATEFKLSSTLYLFPLQRHRRQLCRHQSGAQCFINIYYWSFRVIRRDTFPITDCLSRLLSQILERFRSFRTISAENLHTLLITGMDSLALFGDSSGFLIVYGGSSRAFFRSWRKLRGFFIIFRYSLKSVHRLKGFFDALSRIFTIIDHFQDSETHSSEIHKDCLTIVRILGLFLQGFLWDFVEEILKRISKESQRIPDNCKR